MFKKKKTSLKGQCQQIIIQVTIFYLNLSGLNIIHYYVTDWQAIKWRSVTKRRRQNGSVFEALAPLLTTVTLR